MFCEEETLFGVKSSYRKSETDTQASSSNKDLHFKLHPWATVRASEAEAGATGDRRAIGSHTGQVRADREEAEESLLKQAPTYPETEGKNIGVLGRCVYETRMKGEEDSRKGNSTIKQKTSQNQQILLLKRQRLVG